MFVIIWAPDRLDNLGSNDLFMKLWLIYISAPSNCGLMLHLLRKYSIYSLTQAINVYPQIISHVVTGIDGIRISKGSNFLSAAVSENGYSFKLLITAVMSALDEYKNLGTSLVEV